MILILLILVDLILRTNSKCIVVKYYYGWRIATCLLFVLLIQAKFLCLLSLWVGTPLLHWEALCNGKI